MINIGILGHGHVGKKIYELLINDDKVNVVSVVTKNIHSEKDSSVFSTSINSLIDNPDIDLIIEVVSDLSVAKDIILKAIENKKHVITANNELIYKYGKAISKLAKKNNVTVYFNSLIATGIPEKKLDVDSLTSNNLHNFADAEVFIFRGATGDIKANEMKNDVYRCMGDYDL